MEIIKVLVIYDQLTDPMSRPLINQLTEPKPSPLINQLTDPKPHPLINQLTDREPHPLLNHDKLKPHLHSLQQVFRLVEETEEPGGNPPAQGEHAAYLHSGVQFKGIYAGPRRNTEGSKQNSFMKLKCFTTSKNPEFPGKQEESRTQSTLQSVPMQLRLLHSEQLQGEPQRIGIWKWGGACGWERGQGLKLGNGEGLLI